MKCMHARTQSPRGLKESLRLESLGTGCEFRRPLHDNDSTNTTTNNNNNDTKQTDK